MKLIFTLSLLLIHFIAFTQTEYFDDFENYDSLQFISTQSERWNTWSGQSGGKDDAKVTSKYAYTGNKSLAIVGKSFSEMSDIIFSIPENIDSGIIDIEFYVFAENTMYFNILGNSDLQNSSIFTANLVNEVLEFPSEKCAFKKREWVKLNFNIDLNRGRMNVIINDNHCTTQNFSSLSNISEFYAFDFFAINIDTRFYIDDFKFVYNPISNVINKDLAIQNLKIESQHLAKNFPLEISFFARNFGTDTISSLKCQLFQNDNLVKDTVLTNLQINPTRATKVLFNTINKLGLNQFDVLIKEVEEIELDEYSKDNFKGMEVYEVPDNAPNKKMVYETTAVFPANLLNPIRSILGTDNFIELIINGSTYPEYGALFTSPLNNKINRKVQNLQDKNYLNRLCSEEITLEAKVFFQNFSAYKIDSKNYEFYFEIIGDTSDLKVAFVTKNNLSNQVNFVFDNAPAGLTLSKFEKINDRYKVKISYNSSIQADLVDVVLLGIYNDDFVNNANSIQLQDAVDIGTSNEEISFSNNTFEILKTTISEKVIINSFIESQNMSIYNQFGQRIKYEKAKFGINLIDISPFSNGVYFISSDKLSGIVKFVIMK